MSATKFEFQTEGRWSGGGNAFLDNARLAMRMRPDVFDSSESAIPIIARNHPAERPRGPFILAPQNAWPYGPPYTTGSGLAKWAGLKAATKYWTVRANAVIRISEAIPNAGRKVSPVIHNVLDEGFEQSLDASLTLNSNRILDETQGQIVSIGSINGYRNFGRLIAGFEHYRRSGGTRELHLIGNGSKALITKLMSQADQVGGVRIHVGAFDRAECLAINRGAHAVVLPSLVEASPFTVLEALAVSANVLVSEIPGNVGIVKNHGEFDVRAKFDPQHSTSIGDALLRSDEGELSGVLNSVVSLRESRISDRAWWVDQIASWLQTLDFQTDGTG